MVSRAMRDIWWRSIVMAALLALGWAAASPATPILPVTYDMINGGSGDLTYRDDTYTPDPLGHRDTNYAPLTGGLGKLTDGVIATHNWNVDHSLYVGWYEPDYADPTITFNFGSLVYINGVSISVDNANSGMVTLPWQVDITMGGVTKTFFISPDLDPAPRTYTYAGLGLEGDQLSLTLHQVDAHFVMLSEVQFDSGVVPLPPGALLFGSGLLGLVGWRRFRKG